MPPQTDPTQTNTRNPIWIQLLGLLLGLFITDISAQTVPDRVQIERQQQERMDAQRNQQIQEQIQRKTTLSGSSPATDNTLETGTGSTCYPIHDIRWDNDESEKALADIKQARISRTLNTQAQRYLKAHQGCLTREHIIELQNQLANELIKQGYLTSRVIVPDQNITMGTLQLSWQAGLIQSVQQNASAIGWSGMLMPLQEGRLYNQRTMDQALENLHRLPSQVNAQTQLLPGDHTNASIIQYQMLPTPLKERISGSIGIDNSGTRDSGRYQTNASVSVDSPLGLYDQLTLNIGSNANVTQKQYRNRNYGAYWDVPMGYLNLQLAATQSDYLRTVPGYHSDLSYTGKTQEHYANLSWTAYRTEHSIGNTNFKLARKRTYSYVDDTELDIQRKDYIYAQLGWAHRLYYQNQQYQLGLDYKFSLPGESQNLGYIYCQPQWDGHFNVLTLNASARIPFQWKQQRWQYYGLLKAQKGSRIQPDAELFSLGSRYNVRGTDEQYGLSAEDGFLWRNELSWLYRAELQPYLGLDWGITHGPSAASIGRTLAGGVLGLRGQYKGLTYDLTMGYPIHKPSEFTQKGPSWVGNINYYF